jgi:4'-phosphopantetheinyl transferase EntD
MSLPPLLNLFPHCVAIAVAAEDDDPAPLFPDEIAAVRRAVPSRQREFAAGRTCARRALESLGVPAGAIPVGPHRAPVWPDGVVGSITHCKGFTGAVVALASCVRSVGFDAEPAQALQPDLHRLICTPEEVAWLVSAPNRRGDWGKLIFSAKESVHKCLYPLYGITLDFLDVTIMFAPDGNTFAAREADGRSTDGVDLHRVRGRLTVSDTHVFTGAFVDRAY